MLGLTGDFGKGGDTMQYFPPLNLLAQGRPTGCSTHFGKRQRGLPSTAARHTSRISTALGGTPTN